MKRTMNRALAALCAACLAWGWAPVEVSASTPPPPHFQSIKLVNNMRSSTSVTCKWTGGGSSCQRTYSLTAGQTKIIDVHTGQSGPCVCTSGTTHDGTCHADWFKAWRGSKMDRISGTWYSKVTVTIAPNGDVDVIDTSNVCEPPGYVPPKKCCPRCNRRGMRPRARPRARRRACTPRRYRFGPVSR